MYEYTSKNCTVILADDDQDFVDSTCDFFELNGVKVIGTCSNGYDAVTLVQQHKPSCVILDLNMPQYDGYYAIDKISKACPEVRIFVLSGSITVNSIDYVEKIFVKPTSLKILLDSILDTCDSLEKNYTL